MVSLKAFVASHIAWFALAGVVFFAGRAWLVEHDARLRAEDGEVLLRQQMSARDAQVQKEVQVITRVVHENQTPQQVVQAIPQLTDLPLNTRVIPNNVADVQVNAPALIELAGEAKECSITLKACQQNLADERKITEGYKKAAGHRGFFGKVYYGAKQVGLLGIGIALGRVL